MNETPFEKNTRRSLAFRVAIIPVVAIVNFAINLFGFVMATRRRAEPLPPPHLGEMFMVGAMPAIAWVVLSIPVQWATRRLVRRRIPVAVACHVLIGAAYTRRFIGRSATA